MYVHCMTQYLWYTIADALCLKIVLCVGPISRMSRFSFLI